MDFIVDSNLLVLWIVGVTAPAHLGRHKNLKGFDPGDYDLLLKLTTGARSIQVTPHILAETSNLIRQIGDPLRQQLTRALGQRIAGLSEIFVESREAADDRIFPRLGLTDATIMNLAQGKAVVLTTDAILYRALLDRGLNAENFNYHRDTLYGSS